MKLVLVAHFMRMVRHPCRSATLCVLYLFGGCTGNVSDQDLGPGTAPPMVGMVGAGSPAGLPSAGTGAPAAGPGPACVNEPNAVGRAPLRRLTAFEYDNSVRDLLGDTTSPARALPSEEIGNGFGNDADAQSVSTLLAEQYGNAAEDIAGRATETPAALAKLDACAMGLTAAREATCARTILEKLATRAYRRALAADDVESLLALYTAARAQASFQTGLATAIEALLQTPDFLYRVELGAADSGTPGRRRPTGDEMATRLSYLFWGTMPDDSLRAAAQRGELSNAQGILTHAGRMLDDPRSRAVVRFFFDNLLPISSLRQLERDPMLYPDWSAQIGQWMHEETQTFLEHEIFSGSGTWPGILTAPYSFVNDGLAKFYRMPAVTGGTFQKVALDTTQRLGLLTQGALMAGTTTANHTNPVIRGAFVARQLLCRPLVLPSDPDLLAMIKPPDPYSGKTARERYSAHSRDPVCGACHRQMDPIGLTFENLDPVGRYRTAENGVTIDASGELPGVPGAVPNAVGLVQALAAQEEAHACFASHWLAYGYGRSLEDADPSDACLKERVAAAFKAAGYNIKKLLLELTQTEAFLYLPGP